VGPQIERLLREAAGAPPATAAASAGTPPRAARRSYRRPEEVSDEELLAALRAHPDHPRNPSFPFPPSRGEGDATLHFASRPILQRGRAGAACAKPSGTRVSVRPGADASPTVKLHTSSRRVQLRWKSQRPAARRAV
jgi:hypothetical protein